MKPPWRKDLNGDPLPWLWELDADRPGVRYFTLLDILDMPPDHVYVVAARQGVMASGPVPAILSNQNPQGYWIRPGTGYLPKYQGTIWSVIFLAQLGADGNDPRVRAACEYVLEHSCCTLGGFSYDGQPGGTIQCLQGNLCAALIDLGWLNDDRLRKALDWLARSVTGEGIAPAEEQNNPQRYYSSGNSAPGFVCAANNQKPCAWAAVKALLAFSKVPESLRTPEIWAPIQAGLGFLLGRDPARADYPAPFASPPSPRWFQFGYPLADASDVLQNLEVLTALGYAGDPRLNAAYALLLSKQDLQGRWKLESTGNGRTWADVEREGEPSKWVTLRALRVLKRRAEALL
ncbi:MAG TPA: hypothetical protein VMT46_01935 [Anaerolineaceae bacterium]|nr:hypothetical protein [Anaerolineaceae bacterium]